MTETPVSKDPNKTHKPHYSANFFSKLSLGLSLLAIGASLYSIHFNQRADLHLGLQQEQLGSSVQGLQQSQENLSLALKTLQENVRTAAPQGKSGSEELDTPWILKEALQDLKFAKELIKNDSNPSLAELLINKSLLLLKTSQKRPLQSTAKNLFNALAVFQKTYRSHLLDTMQTLDLLQNQCLELVIKEPGFTNNKAPVVPATDSPKLWRDRLKDSLNLLEKVIVVHKQDDNVNPLLLPLYQKIVLESIRMNLQEAQWALLSFNKALYTQSLNQVEQELSRYTAQDASINRAFLSGLQKAKIAFEEQSTNDLVNAVSDAQVNLEQALADSSNPLTEGESQ